MTSDLRQLVEHRFDDPAVPELAVLLGPRAIDALAPAITAEGHLLDRIRVSQVLYRPRSGATISYRAELVTGEGRRSITLVAACGRDRPESAPTVQSGGARVAVYTPYTDPALPGLGRALEPSVVRGLLRDLGVGSGDLRMRLRSYRPGRRAVVEASGSFGRVFLKIVPVDQVERLQNRHAELADHLPVPNTHGWSPELGVVVLRAIEGRTLRHAIRSGSASLPPATALEDLLDRLPHASTPRRGWGHRHHSELLTALLPLLAPRLSDISRRLDALQLGSAAEEVAVHGDLHDAQLLVEEGRIIGLLDVEAHAAGYRSDDLGTFLAHLAVASLDDRGARSASYLGDLLTQLDGRHPRRVLLGAAAARLLGLATGPFRVMQPCWSAQSRARVRLAERWLAAAEGETPLTAITEPAHPRTTSS